MLNAFEFLFANLGMSITNVYLLLIVLVSLIFSASDYRIGLIMLQVFSFLGVVIFSFGDYNTEILLYTGLLTIVFMVITTYADKTSNARGVV
jgi:hypothetical protein